MQRRVATLLAALITPAIMISSVACNQLQSDPITLIKGLRLVAVRATPPFIAGPGLVAPPVGSPTHFQPLVIGHDLKKGLCYAWRLCPFAWDKDGNYRCLDPKLEVDLGTKPTATATALDVFASLEHAEEVAKKIGINLGGQGSGGPSGGGQPVESTLGLQVYVLFMIGRPAVWGGTCPTDSAKMIRDVCPTRDGCVAGYTKIALATSPKHTNEMPIIEGMTLDGVDWPQGMTPTVAPVPETTSTGGQGPNPGAKDLGVEVAPVFDEATLQIIKKATATQPAVTENLSFSWFSDNGRFRYSKTNYRVHKNRFLAAKPGKDREEDDGKKQIPATIWMVARDNRNGVTWTSRNLIVDTTATTDVHPLCAMNAQLKGCAEVLGK